MKNAIHFFKVFVLLSILFSCERKDEYAGSFDVSGRIAFDQGAVAANSKIYLNNELRATTNNEGDFTIPGVDAGRYTLKATLSDSSSAYAEAELEIDLKGGDLYLDNLLLPVPVELLEPDSVRSTSINLTWRKCNADDFREYKIYIHHSGALDESTGTLLHISTEVNDTTLSIKEGDFWWGGSTLSPDTKYYFRVFVMNSNGRMSGSNIRDVTTSLWDNAGEFTNNYRLDPEISFAAQGNLTGIAWDGSYFWMLYFEEKGGFYDNNQVTLVKYDYLQGTALRTIIFDDSNYFPEGISWDGTNVWISFGPCIRSVDLENGTLDRTYCAGQVTVDLAWDEEELLLLDVWNKVISLNPVNGMIGRQFETPFKLIGYSGEKGISSREGEIWIINNWHHEICILDKQGDHIGVAEVDFLQEDLNSNGHRMPMCFMDEKLVIAIDSQVKIYSVEQID